MTNRAAPSFPSISIPAIPAPARPIAAPIVSISPFRPAPRAPYRAILEKALARLSEYRPDLVAVSAGFDAYRHDPLAEGALEAEDFHWLGESVRQLAVPAFSILEGGYSDDLPQLILAYLSGLAG